MPLAALFELIRAYWRFLRKEHLIF